MASIFPTGLTYSRNTKDPLQSKIVWATLADASVYVNNPDETAYVGMTLAVTNDAVAKNNGLWYVEAIGTKANPTAGVLKKVGSNEVLTADNYSAAVILAKTAPVGTLIKVAASEGSTEENNFHAAGFYIVSVTGANPSILMLSTTSGEDMDLDAVITALSDLQKEVAKKADSGDVYDKDTADATFVKDVQGQNVSIDRATGIVTVDMSGKVDSTTYNQFVKDTNDALDTKLESSDLSEYAKTADVVAKDTYTIDKKVIDDAIEALNTEVGNKAEGETPASGIYKVIDDVATALREDITAIPKFDILPVDELPTEEISESTVYLVKDKDSERDLYTEYIYVNGAWENLGKQTVDLSSYATTTAMNQAISDAIDALKIGDYYKKTEVDNLLNSKADASDLDNYVQTSVLNDYVTVTSLNEYKESVNDTLEGYVTGQSFEDFKDALDKTLENKLEQSDLADYVTSQGLTDTLGSYVTSQSLTDTLGSYVTSQSLTNTLVEYATTTALSDGLDLKADKTSLDSYVLKNAIEVSESLSFVGEAIEITSITNEDLAGIINATE